VCLLRGTDWIFKYNSVSKALSPARDFVCQAAASIGTVWRLCVCVSVCVCVLVVAKLVLLNKRRKWDLWNMNRERERRKSKGRGLLIAGLQFWVEECYRCRGRGVWTELTLVSADRRNAIMAGRFRSTYQSSRLQCGAVNWDSTTGISETKCDYWSGCSKQH
jgi:hypothetical protein